jgi:hypothetical protein
VHGKALGPMFYQNKWQDVKYSLIEFCSTCKIGNNIVTSAWFFYIVFILLEVKTNFKKNIVVLKFEN